MSDKIKLDEKPRPISRMELEDEILVLKESFEKQMQELRAELKSQMGSLVMLHQGIVKWERNYNNLWNTFNAFVSYMMFLVVNGGTYGTSSWPVSQNQFEEGLMNAGRTLFQQAHEHLQEVKRRREQASPPPQSTADVAKAQIIQLTGTDPNGPMPPLPKKEGDN